MFVIFLFLCLGSIVSAAILFPRKESEKPREAVVYMGDSITANWYRLTKSPRFFGNPPINRGITGESTKAMLDRFQRDVFVWRPRAVVILGGTNDIYHWQPSSSLAMTEQNIRLMAEQAQKEKITVILSTIPPISERGDGASSRREIELKLVPELNAWIRDYAHRNSCILLDLHAVLTDEDGSFQPDLTEDGIHPNGKGYALMEIPLEQAVKTAFGR